MKTNTIIKSIIALLLTSGFTAQAETKSITCQQSYRSNQNIVINFLKEDFAQQQVQIIAIIDASTGWTHEMYNFVPSEIESTDTTLYADSSKNTVSVDLKSGQGTIQYHAWEMVCSPGESEWCIIKFPKYIRLNFELENCKQTDQKN